MPTTDTKQRAHELIDQLDSSKLAAGRALPRVHCDGNGDALDRHCLARPRGIWGFGVVGVQIFTLAAIRWAIDNVS